MCIRDRIDGYEVVKNFKYKAFDHNIPLMSKLNNEVTFTGMIEAARSETDWKNIRAYLNILEEYSIYSVSYTHLYGFF